MTRKRRIAVLGAGGHGKVIIDALLEAGHWEIVGILDDDPAKMGKKLIQIPVLGSSSCLGKIADKFGVEGIVVAIGDNYIRHKRFHDVSQSRLRPVRVIHPAAHVSRFAELGEGVVILSGAVVNPGAIIEDNVCVNTSVSIDHDSRLGRSCHVFPNATLTGGVHVGELAYVGAGAVVNPNLAIGNYAYVGSGAVVTQNVAAGVIVAGVPARKIGEQPRRPEVRN